MGQTLMDSRQKWYQPNAWSNQPAVNVCLGVDSERLLRLYQQRISSP
jgi:hypothetical protein